MAYARARQEKYIKTDKGKAAINRSRKKEQKKLRSTSEGREKLKYRKYKCEHGKDVADWWWKQKPICFICGKKVKYEKAPSRKKKEVILMNWLLIIIIQRKNLFLDICCVKGII